MSGIELIGFLFKLRFGIEVGTGRTHSHEDKTRN